MLRFYTITSGSKCCKNTIPLCCAIKRQTSISATILQSESVVSRSLLDQSEPLTHSGLKLIVGISTPFRKFMSTPKSLWWCSRSHFYMTCIARSGLVLTETYRRHWICANISTPDHIDTRAGALPLLRTKPYSYLSQIRAWSGLWEFPYPSECSCPVPNPFGGAHGPIFTCIACNSIGVVNLW